MGFYYRKSVNFGPFRVNLSQRGLGYSIGGRGFRTGVSSGGRRYSSFSLPGTGLGYRSYSSKRAAQGCALMLACPFAAGLAAWIIGHFVWR